MILGVIHLSKNSIFISLMYNYPPTAGSSSISVNISSRAFHVGKELYICRKEIV